MCLVCQKERNDINLVLWFNYGMKSKFLLFTFFDINTISFRLSSPSVTFFLLTEQPKDLLFLPLR